MNEKISLVLSDLLESLEGMSQDEKIDSLNEIGKRLKEVSPVNSHPVSHIQWVPISDVRSNDYNPNFTAVEEMRLLKLSIESDGYSQPVVTVEDGEGGYVIVDGFHRYETARRNADIRDTTHGRIPVVVLHKDMADRMASTVRHNRARGKHTIQGMSGLIMGMLEEGQSDEDICNKLGMEAEELIRMKHITGFFRRFKKGEFTKETIAGSQVRARIEWEKKHGKRSDPRVN